MKRKECEKRSERERKKNTFNAQSKNIMENLKRRARQWGTMNERFPPHATVPAWAICLCAWLCLTFTWQASSVCFEKTLGTMLALVLIVHMSCVHRLTSLCGVRTDHFPSYNHARASHLQCTIFLITFFVSFSHFRFNIWLFAFDACRILYLKKRYLHAVQIVTKHTK